MADVRSEEGEIFTIHCPNTGKMTSCAEPGFTVYFSHSDNPKRKYAHTWELAQDSTGHFIGINSAKANYLVKEAISAGLVAPLDGYAKLQTEIAYGNEGSRIDLLLSDPKKPECYVEVKSVTLLDESLGKGCGFFPDTVSVRGRKHLRELTEMKRQGFRAVLMFCVQHTGIQSVSIAEHIDAAYMSEVKLAVKAGVEILAYACEISAKQNNLSVPVSICIEGVA